MQPIPSKPDKGLFFAIDGGDGCGKTTQLVKWIDAIGKIFPGREIVRHKHPAMAGVAGILRCLVLGTPVTAYTENGIGFYQNDPKTEPGDLPSKWSAYWLFFAEWLHSYETVVAPALARDAIVVSDRAYPVVTTAYLYGDGVDPIEINRLTALCFHYTRQPDLVYAFTAPAELQRERAMSRGGQGGEQNHLDEVPLSIYEGRNAGYRYAASLWPKMVEEFDAVGTIDEVHARLMDRFTMWLIESTKEIATEEVGRASAYVTDCYRALEPVNA